MRSVRIFFLMIACVFFLHALPAHAQTIPDVRPTIDQFTKYSICNKYQGYTGKVVRCLRELVVDSTIKFETGIYKYVKGIVYAAVTLSIIMFGLLLMGGYLEKPSGDTFTVILKIAGVLYATANFPDIFQMSLDGSEGLMNIASHAANGPWGRCGFTEDVWVRLDCVMNMVVGISYPSGFAAGISGMVMSILFSSVIGSILFLAGILFVFTLVFTVMRSAMIYINSFVALALISLFAPLAIPLIMFRYTQPFFKSWLKMYMGFLIQPIFLTAYLGMMITAYDTVVFTGNQSLYRTMAGDIVVTDPNFSIGKYFTDNNLYTHDLFQGFGIQLAADPVVPGQDVSPSQSAMMGKIIEMVKSGADYAAGLVAKQLGLDIKLTVVDIKKWAALRGMPPGELLRQLLISIILATMMSYIMYATLSYIPAMGTELSGGALDMINLAGSMPGERIATRVAEKFGGGGGKK